MECISTDALLIHSAVEKKDENLIKYLHSEGRSINARDRKGLSPLHLAAYIGCKNTAEVLLSLGASIKLKSKDGNLAIHVACQQGSIDVVKLLLDNDCDKNILGCDFNTPLHFAIYNGWSEVALVLLERRCDVNMRNKSGLTPLHLAAMNGDFNCTELLLKFGAYAHSLTKMGNTALHLAAESGKKDIATILLTYGSEVYDTNNFYETRSEIAKFDKPKFVTRFLTEVDYPNLYRKDSYGRTAFHIAARKGHCQTMKELLQYGLKFSNLNLEGWSVIIQSMANGKLTNLEPLLEVYEPFENYAKMEKVPSDAIDNKVFKAVLKNDISELNILCSQGANFNSVDEQGFTPLHLAVFMKNITIVSALLKSGANPNVAIQDFIYPIHIACLLGYFDIVKLLLEYKCDIHIVHGLLRTIPFRNLLVTFKPGVQFAFVCKGTDFEMWNQFSLCPLHLAVGRGDVKMAEILLENGARTSCLDILGNTPLHAAIEFGKINIAASLLKYDKKIHVLNTRRQTPIHLAAKLRRYDILKKLLEEDNNIDSHIFDMNGNTALHIAAANGAVEVLEILLKHDFNIDCLNIIKQTALHVAVILNKQDVLEYLLKHNANPHILDEDGKAPIHLASEMHHNSHVLMALLVGGSDPNIADLIGNTPLHSTSTEDIWSVLLRYGADINKVNKRNETPLETALRDRSYYEYSSSKKIKCLIQHTLCHQVKGLITNQNIFKIIESDKYLSEYYETCSNELEKSKNIVIGNTSIPYYNFLVGNIDVLATFVKNPEIRYAFSNNFLLDGELGALAYDNYKEAIRRSHLLDTAHIWFKESMGILSNLPNECIVHILKFLKTVELLRIPTKKGNNLK